MKPHVTVRVATRTDAAALARMNAVFNESAATPEQLAAQLMAAFPVEQALIAELDQAVCGFACVRIHRAVCYASPVGELTELYVEPQARRSGVGRALVQAAEALARAAGVEALLVATGFENTQAQQLYHHCGFKNEGLLLAKVLNEVSE